MKGTVAYAAVVAGHTNHQQTSGQLKPKANGLEPSKPAVFSEAASRRMSCEDTSGPLGTMPAGTTPAQSVPAGKRPNKNPIFVTRVTETRDFLT
jgi:hypothetical protein